MPNYTLAEIMSQATTRAGRRADISKSDVSFWVNAAYEEVREQAEPMNFLEKLAVSSTTSGENRVDLPSDFDGIIGLSITTTGPSSPHTLIASNAADIDNIGFYPVGEPQRYVLYSNWLELHPSPDSAYSLQMRYRSFLTDMTAETDIPSLDTPWRKAILYLTEAEIWAYVDNPAQEAIARQRYVNYASTLKNTIAKRQQDKSGMRVRPVYPEVRPKSKRSFDLV